MILTDEDIKAIFDNEKGGDYYDMVWAIEAAILEKLSRAESIYQFRPDCENWIDCTEKFYADWGGEKRTLFTHPPAPISAEPVPDKTKIECVAGAISKHISTSLYQREVIAAAQYIVHRYCCPPSKETK